MSRISYWIETTFGSPLFAVLFVASFAVIVWSMF